MVESKKVIDDREAKLKQYMTDIKGPDGMFEGFVDHLRTCTGASGVYVGRLEVIIESCIIVSLVCIADIMFMCLCLK